MKARIAVFLLTSVFLSTLVLYASEQAGKPEKFKFKDLFVTPAKDWTYAEIAQENTPDKLACRPVAKNEGYLSIWLESYRIVNVRKGLKRFFGTVYSYISIPTIQGQKAEFQVVTTPGKLQALDAKNVDHVIDLNQRLLGPIPYRGGDVSVEIGLCSIKEADLAAPFLGILDSLSKSAGVSFLSAALPFAGPLKDGINLLAGASSDSILEIGLKRAYNPAKIGYFAVVRAPSTTVNADILRVDKDLRLVDTSGKPISNYPYLVIKAEVSPRRDDWFLIPDLAIAHKAVYDEVKSGSVDKIKEALAAFHRSALSCLDLFLSDSQRLINEVDADVKIVLDEIENLHLKTILVKVPSIRNLKEIKLFK